MSLRRPLGLVLKRNRSQWEEKLPASKSLKSSEREERDLGSEPTKKFTVITEVKEKDTEPKGRTGVPQGSDNNTRQKFPSGYCHCDIEEGSSLDS